MTSFESVPYLYIHTGAHQGKLALVRRAGAHTPRLCLRAAAPSPLLAATAPLQTAAAREPGKAPGQTAARGLPTRPLANTHLFWGMERGGQV